MKLNWFAEREREVLKVNDSNRMKIVMCVHVLVKYISEISIHIPICVKLYRGMHCITIQWCLKIWQSKIVTWFSKNNNDMRSTQNNFFSFPFLFSAIDFHSHNFLRFLPSFCLDFFQWELSKKRWRWRCNMIKLDVTNVAFQF